MPAVNLTDAFVRSAKAQDGKVTEYPDKRERGLALRVSPSGEKSWTFRYRTLARQQKRMSLGKVRDVSLSKARDAVVKHRATVANGGDPVVDAQQARQNAIQELERETVGELGRWYFDECAVGRHKANAKPKRPSTLRTERLYFDKHIEPRLGRIKAADLKRAQIQHLINDLADKHSKSAARHSKVVLQGIFAFAKRHEIVDTNPCDNVDLPAMEARETVLSDEQLRTIWTTLTPPIETKGLRISGGIACSILLAMVTLQRRAEITGMRLSELDLERRLWVLPSSRTKNRRDHVVPLSELAIELIKRALDCRAVESEFVFPSPRDAAKPVDPQALTHAFVRMRDAISLGDARPHDLRRTGATNMTGEHIGIPRFIVSLVLNHASDTGGSRVTGIYDRNEYTPQKRRALDAWAAYLQQITGDGAEASNVVPIRQW